MKPAQRQTFHHSKVKMRFSAPTSRFSALANQAQTPVNALSFGPGAVLPNRRQMHLAARRTRLYLLLQVFLCAIPSSVLFALGKAQLAGVCFWVAIGLILARLIALHRPDQVLILLVALVPFIELFRQAAFYNVVVFLFGAAVGYVGLALPSILLSAVGNRPLVVKLIIFVTIYYLISLIITGAYEVRLRDFELVFVAVAVLVLSRRRELLITALQGVLISAGAIGMAMLPYINSFADERLGQVMLEGQRMGNPVQLGGSLAFCFLGVTVDRGAWFGLKNSPVKSLLYQGCVAILLALTSSRAAWLASIVGVLTMLAFAHRSKMNSRRTVLYSVAVVALVIQIVLLSPYGGALQKGLSRTFKEDDTLRHRTTGRSDQWVVAYHAITDSFGSLVYGHGPGLGSKVYAEYSQKVEDIEYDVGQEAPFHSLYLELAVEAGALGVIPVILWIVFVGSRVLRWIRLRAALLPAACFFAWVSITLSVGGNGAIGGLYIGLGLIADLRNRQLSRRFS
jgi:hypothetical protein